MYLLSAVVLVIGIYIFASKPGSMIRRWIAAFMFSLAPGLLSTALYMANSGQEAGYLEKLLYARVSSYLYMESNCFMPYTLLVTSILVLQYGKARKPGLPLKLILLAPVIVTHIAYPPGPSFSPEAFAPLYIPWSLLYYLAGAVLAVYSWITAKDPRFRTKKIITSGMILSTSVTTMVLGYALPLAFQSLFYEAFRGMIIVILAVFTAIALRYGLLGIRLRMERAHYSAMTGSMSPGAALLSHSIKNEINKIAVCADNIRSRFASDDPYFTGNMGIIEHSVAHLMRMTERIRFHMQDYDLCESVNRLTDIAEDAISSMDPVFTARHVAVMRDFQADISLICDSAHIREVLVNILSNAAEAVNADARIEICIFVLRKAPHIIVRDNGKGIPAEDMPYIFNPFFTTKRSRANYGLGLSYCYGVMKKHGGSIKAVSQPEGGTEIVLRFPVKRVVCAEGGEPNG